MQAKLNLTNSQWNKSLYSRTLLYLRGELVDIWTVVNVVVVGGTANAQNNLWLWALFIWLQKCRL